MLERKPLPRRTKPVKVAVSKEHLYPVWSTMHARCENPKHNRYHRYGARGIRVDQVWATYPALRSWAMESGWEPGLTIDRINSDGNYCPENCRWATVTEQNRNKGNNRTVLFEGIEQSLSQWAEDPRCAVSYKILWERLDAGWDFETALITSQKIR